MEVTGHRARPGKVDGEVSVSHRIHSVNDVAALVGQHLGYSDYTTLTQGMIDGFAEVTGDHQWIHVDPVRAADGPFGTTIAHGYLTLSLIPALLNQVLVVDLPGARINYGLNRVRFVSPVPSGSEVRLGATVTGVEAVGEAWQITLDVSLEQRGAAKPACVAQILYRWYPQ